MATYWKEKVLPTIRKVIPGEGKRTAAAEASKTFDESKEGIIKEIEENKTELGPKVLEIYEASTTQIKVLVKKPTKPGLKKNSAGVVKFFEELVKIEFPGSKSVSESLPKFGPVLYSGPVAFIFEKVVTFLPEEPAPAAEAALAEVETREITVEEVKKEEPAAEAPAEPAPAAPEAEKPSELPEEPKPAAEPEKKPEPAPEPAKA